MPAALGAVVLLLVVLGLVTFAVYVHRKLLGWMQGRHGPTHTGPYGLLQTIADTVKLLQKEDVIPAQVDRPLFRLAPIIAFAPSFVVLAVIPFAPGLTFADVGVGLLFYLAVASVTTLGVIAGGWAANNKWSLIGALRSAAQMVSYEVPLALSALAVVLMAGSLNLNAIVEAQARSVWFVIPQALGFVIFLIAALAELNRTPFDLTEAESELVAGYLTEYSGVRFAFFMLSEYVYLFAMGALIATLYFGGWLPPHPALAFVPGIVWFLIKALFFAVLPFWLQATFPRARVDQLMGLAWKGLIPLAMVNLVLTAALKTWL
ncbi:MAG: NADH-quinone oxidoreductase subunit NuoH [Hydrogenibacillus schlegelii]|uniref:NADH-quinone oxidoreductase subunit H n=1 Tax=Hydrogenibacillus schlegelii TaxID=1484 RepID=A0A947CXF8_HYDSH|nr:NADH-quinone oxidoreductase subunit NuoH [Hydrogenibacillus schlegelii]